MAIPQDPLMLYSFVNTKLRDEYSSLEDLCNAYSLDIKKLTQQLADVGFEYMPDINQFR
jgi:hypothetical protein